MCVAARTAPKAKGVDNLETLLVSGEEKDRLSAEMRRIAVEAGMAFFDRDAGCLEKAPVVLLLGQKVKPIGVKPCGYCGHGDCAACAQNGGQCAISIGDLGIAIGSAYLVSQATLEVSHLLIPPRGVEKEVARFDAALAAIRQDFADLKASMAAADLSAFVDLHLMILADPELSEVPRQIIRERRCNAEWAIVQQMGLLVEQFEKIDDVYLRERSYDVRQVVERVVRELAGHSGGRLGKGIKGENLIVVAHDLSPADVIAFREHNFASFITDAGGATSHTAILARGMNIPAVLGLHNARQLIHD